MNPGTLEPLNPRILADQRLVDRWLRDALRFGPEVPGRLAQAMRYALLGPGKRLRPILALEAFRAAGGRKVEWVAPFCCGIEMIHAFSLAHDDLPSMDDDDFRRGRPSLHRKYDEGTAILAADALLALAFELFASGKAPVTRRLAAIAEIARAVGPAGMAGGQMLDIGLTGRVQGFKGSRVVAARPLRERGANARSVGRVHQKKTAEFIAASVACGALIAGAKNSTVRRLSDAGRALGRLFQATDDLLDACKKGEGARQTMVRLHGLAGARRRAVKEAKRAGRLFSSLGPGFGVLAAFPRMVLERTR